MCVFFFFNRKNCTARLTVRLKMESKDQTAASIKNKSLDVSNNRGERQKILEWLVTEGRMNITPVAAIILFKCLRGTSLNIRLGNISWLHSIAPSLCHSALTAWDKSSRSLTPCSNAVWALWRVNLKKRKKKKKTCGSVRLRHQNWFFFSLFFSSG